MRFRHSDVRLTLVIQAMASSNVMCNETLPDEMKRRTVWRKVLYKDQGVPDNYVDESFLDEMRKNCE